MGEAHPEKVIAAIVTSSHHHAPLVAGEEGCSRGDEDLGWECRGIGAQHARGGVTRRKQLLDCMEEGATKPFHALRGRRGAVC